ncbi:MAG: small-conductance mechanosensitive channel, partial [Cognaticolwellia sp.]
MDDTQQLLQFINLQRVPFAIGILVVGLVLNRLALGFLDDLGERFGNQRLLFKKISALLRFSVYVILFGITVSSIVVLESEALIAVAGTIGVAVGFAFKDLLASLMAGVILLMDEPFQVGDRVAFGGYYGEISEIGLRSVRMITLDDNLVTIPNNKFLNEASASANAGALDCMVVIPFYLGAAEDFVAARRLIEEATATSRYVFLDKPMTTLVSDEFMGERFVTVVRVK